MRFRILLALAGFAMCGGNAQTGLRDRYFARYPFEKWQAAGDKAGIRWVVKVHPAALTAHQRLAARIEVELESKEIAKRRGRGELVSLIQVENPSGRRWRIHNVFDLSRIPQDAKAPGLAWVQDAFVLPGDYTVSIATCDSATGDYSFARRVLHVLPLRGDTLTSAWTDLPEVEFVRPYDAPDSWFQPWIRGRVRMGVATTRPVHIEILMNLTPSERASGSVRAFRRNMSVLVPALKILAALEVSKGSLDVTLVDLTRRKTWEEKDARGLDWTKMRAPLAETQPGIIDAQSLAAKQRMAQFFRDQVLARAQPRADRDELRVVIVLSAPAFLGRQSPLETANLERDPNRRIFYLRYRPEPPRPDIPSYTTAPPPGMTSLPSDDLERALKPLDARILSAASPGEFRRALSAMLADIGRM
jgi:hypothetical protein